MFIRSGRLVAMADAAAAAGAVALLMLAHLRSVLRLLNRLQDDGRGTRTAQECVSDAAKTAATCNVLPAAATAQLNTLTAVPTWRGRNAKQERYREDTHELKSL